MPAARFLKFKWSIGLKALELYGKAMGYFAEGEQLVVPSTATTLTVQFVASPPKRE